VPGARGGAGRWHGLHGLKRLRKDNTGYDLRHLLIGAEGTLGIITAASLRLVPRPAAEGAALLVVPKARGGAATCWRWPRRGCRAGVGLRADQRHGAGLSGRNHAEVRQPFADTPDWMVLVELGLPKASTRPSAGWLFAEADEAGLVQRRRDRHVQAQRALLAHPRNDPRGEPPDRRGVVAMTSRCPCPPCPISSPGPGALAAAGDFASTASAIWATATCITTSFPPGPQPRQDHENQRDAIKTPGA
jgi:hypothetical protein